MRTLFITWDGPQVSYLESLFLPIFEALGAQGFPFDILQFRWGDVAQEQHIRERSRQAESATWHGRYGEEWAASHLSRRRLQVVARSSGRHDDSVPI
jgi:hypothetical protein